VDAHHPVTTTTTTKETDMNRTTWTLDADCPAGTLVAIVAEVLHRADGVSAGSCYESAYSMVGNNIHPPVELVQLQDACRERGISSAI
jgi:hypothetical protein